MAIGTPTSLGSNTSNVSGTTVAITGVNASVGDFVIVIMGAANALATTCTITDTATNTWGLDVTANGTNFATYIRSAQITSAITAGTITATLNVAAASRNICAVKVSGIVTSSALDKTASATGTVVGWDSGVTATTVQADELVIGGSGSDSAGAETSTAGASLTELFDLTNGSAFQTTAVYRIVSATGTYSASGTWTNSGSRNWSAAVATYKGDATAAAEIPILVMARHR